MPEKIQILTSPQRDQIQIVHQIFYDMALETETNEVCLRNAEAAAERLTRGTLMPGYQVVWVGNLKQGEARYHMRLRETFGSLGLTDSMYDAISRALQVEASDHIKDNKKAALCDLVYQRVSRECYNEGYNINVELTNELTPIRSQGKLASSTVLNLVDDLPWAAECSYWARTLPEGCGVDLALWITAVHDFFEAAHALWVLPGEIIICKKPVQVTTDSSEGRLIEMHWTPIPNAEA